MFKKRKTAELAVYMSDVEFSQLLAIFEALGPSTCLEWGSGGSTRALLAECPFVQRYVSVEHDATWYENVRSQIDDPRLELHCVAPNQPMAVPHSREEEIAWCARGEVERSVFRDYVDFPATLGTRFDLVLVDGRARNFCIAEGFRLLRSGGVLVLHDAQRTDYHAAMHQLGRCRFLEPWSQGQLCLVRKA